MQRVERSAIHTAHPGRERRGLLVALHQRTLDFLVVCLAGQGRATRDYDCQSLQSCFQSASIAIASRTTNAKSSTARASATRSSTVRMTVGAVST